MFFTLIFLGAFFTVLQLLLFVLEFLEHFVEHALQVFFNQGLQFLVTYALILVILQDLLCFSVDDGVKGLIQLLQVSRLFQSKLIQRGNGLHDSFTSSGPVDELLNIMVANLDLFMELFTVIVYFLQSFLEMFPETLNLEVESADMG